MNRKGYIERVGEFFEEYGLSIDNIVSSETSITLTVNEKDLSGQGMEDLICKLQTYLITLE